MSNAQLKQRAAKKYGSRPLVLFAVLSLVLLGDQLSKYYFMNSYPAGSLVPGTEWGIVQFYIVHNTGAAWGVLSQSTELLGWFALAVSVGVWLYASLDYKNTSLPQALCLCLVAAGGLGNALDRLYRGFVLDFIQLPWVQFPVFNIADIGITLGFIGYFGLLIYASYTERGEHDSAKR